LHHTECDRSWALTRIFRGHLAVVGSGGTLDADQSPIWRTNPRIRLPRSERKKHGQRHHCARRNHKDCMPSHPINMRPESALCQPLPALVPSSLAFRGVRDPRSEINFRVSFPGVRVARSTTPNLNWCLPVLPGVRPGRASQQRSSFASPQVPSSVPPLRDQGRLRSHVKPGDVLPTFCHYVWHRLAVAV